MSDDDIFEYGGVRTPMDFEAMRLAQEALYDHLAEAEETEVSQDGWEFCGCPTCVDRVVSGFWVSWTLTMVRQGRIG